MLKFNVELISGTGDITVTGFKKLMAKIDKMEFEKTLQQAALFMISSTMSGYQKTVDPLGKQWEPLADWYKYRPMDDGIARPPKNPVTASSKPLTNTRGMKNSLTFQFVGKDTVIVGYGDKTQGIKAEIHQESITNFYRIEKKGKILSIDVTPKQRINIGFSAKIPRIGRYDDITTIAKLFEQMIDKAMR